MAREENKRGPKQHLLRNKKLSANSENYQNWGAAVASQKRKELQESHTAPYISGQLNIGFIFPC